MRKITLAIAALAAIGLALPVMPANAENAVIIKTDRDHDHDWQRHHHHKRVVVLKTHHDRDHDHDHDRN